MAGLDLAAVVPKQPSHIRLADKLRQPAVPHEKQVDNFVHPPGNENAHDQNL
jgi:hypothetical protein